ncbi:MAG: 3-hydroxyacyl-CoA dehydrogenase family protein [Eubacterium sp.]|nr:3-hydroxyacyl-CoA dehydrogenase family protein [Eubacterium sp.]
MNVSDIKNVAGIGGGVIGGSWAVLFAMKGLKVKLYDINDDCIANDKKTIEGNLDFLAANGAIKDRASVEANISFTTSMEEAVKDAQFIQESGPERINIKQDMLAQIEAAAPADAIIASSASGLPIGQIAENATHPERIIGGHPYNPPHLIPLVELTKNPNTTEENVQLAKEFYESLGKEAIILRKDCPGYICNRLQLAVFREMIDLVERGVCSVEDADKALTFGPGIRWAIFGHNMIMQLGNKDGISGMIDMLGGGFNLCADIAAWDTIPADYGKLAQEQVDEMMKNYSDEIGHDNAAIAQYRDKMLIDILKLHGKF